MTKRMVLRRKLATRPQPQAVGGTPKAPQGAAPVERGTIANVNISSTVSNSAIVRRQVMEAIEADVARRLASLNAADVLDGAVSSYGATNLGGRNRQESRATAEEEMAAFGVRPEDFTMSLDDLTNRVHTYRDATASYLRGSSGVWRGRCQMQEKALRYLQFARLNRVSTPSLDVALSLDDTVHILAELHDQHLFKDTEGVWTTLDI